MIGLIDKTIEQYLSYEAEKVLSFRKENVILEKVIYT